MHGDMSTDHKPCKDWCASKNNCSGFAVDKNNKCYFKGPGCVKDLCHLHRKTLYLKQGIPMGKQFLR